MHATNKGDYSADDLLLNFQKANLAIIHDILLDNDPTARDIEFLRCLGKHPIKADYTNKEA